MSVVEKAIAWALRIANDPTHGYDQTNRWGPDYDCSSFVISAYKAAGLPLTATYTGNMRDCLRAAGWQVLPSNTTLEPGDILLNNLHHTAIYIVAIDFMLKLTLSRIILID